MSTETTHARPRGRALLQQAGDSCVRRILRSPLHGMLSRKLLIITVTGRKTGHAYAIPVGYVEHDGFLLIGTAARWHRNLRPDVPVRARVRGHNIEADPEIVADEGPAIELYRVILAGNPVHGRFAGIRIEPDGSANTADLRRALAEGTVVVRLHPRTS